MWCEKKKCFGAKKQHIYGATKWEKKFTRGARDTIGWMEWFRILPLFRWFFQPPRLCANEVCRSTGTALLRSVWWFFRRALFLFRAQSMRPDSIWLRYAEIPYSANAFKHNSTIGEWVVELNVGKMKENNKKKSNLYRNMRLLPHRLIADQLFTFNIPLKIDASNTSIRFTLSIIYKFIHRFGTAFITDVDLFGYSSMDRTNENKTTM